jgi:hypothetical protein
MRRGRRPGCRRSKIAWLSFRESFRCVTPGVSHERKPRSRTAMRKTATIEAVEVPGWSHNAEGGSARACQRAGR